MQDTPTWEHEQRLWDLGSLTVAGCDEAGRGPLAGPVVAGAVVLPRGCVLAGLTDSKLLDERARERLFDEVHAAAVAVGVGQASAAEIDELNILRASLLAMRRAVAALGLPVDGLLVDGQQTVPGLSVRQFAVVKGDRLSWSIAAASILAKVTRDRQLVALDAAWPGYGFAGHKGYPSPSHLAALRTLGPCPEHRRSYGPVRALLAEPPPLPPSKSRGATAQQLSLFGDGDE